MISKRTSNQNILFSLETVLKNGEGNKGDVESIYVQE